MKNIKSLKLFFAFFKFTIVSLLLLFLCRFYFYFESEAFFSNLNTKDLFISFFHGVRFDLSAFFYVNGILFLLMTFRFIKESFLFKYIFSLLNTIIYTVHFIDIEFFRSYGRRIDLNFFSIIEGTNTGNMFSILKSYSYGLILFLIFYSLFLFLYKYFFTFKIRFSIKEMPLTILIILTVSIIGMRGGLHGGKVLSRSHSYLYSGGKAESAVLSLNSLFSVIRSKKKREFPSELLEIVESHEITRVPLKKISQNKNSSRNVVIVFIESLSAYSLKKLKEEKRWNGELFPEPNIGETFSTDNFFSNGEFSADALISIFFGMPSLFKARLIYSDYPENKWYGLGTVLKEKGKDSFFIHAASKGTQSFDSISAAAGIEDFYSVYDSVKRNQKFENGWGVHDQILYKESREIISKYKNPFFGVLFTTSSHAPFDPPPGYEGASGKGDITEKYLSTIEYSLKSLQKFFQDVKTEKWFKDTLFVVMGDHNPPFRNKDMDVLGVRNRLPLLLYKKGADFRGAIKKQGVLQHIDISKTVFDIMGAHPVEWSPFGKSIFDISDRGYFYNSNGYFNHITEDCIYQIPYVKSLKSKAPKKRFNGAHCSDSKFMQVKRKTFDFVKSYIYRLEKNLLYE